MFLFSFATFGNKILFDCIVKLWKYSDSEAFEGSPPSKFRWSFSVKITEWNARWWFRICCFKCGYQSRKETPDPCSRDLKFSIYHLDIDIKAPFQCHFYANKTGRKAKKFLISKRTMEKALPSAWPVESIFMSPNEKWSTLHIFPCYHEDHLLRESARCKISFFYLTVCENSRQQVLIWGQLSLFRVGKNNQIVRGKTTW